MATLHPPLPPVTTRTSTSESPHQPDTPHSPQPLQPLPPPGGIHVCLGQPSQGKKGRSKSTQIFRRFRSVFRSFPIITPTCKMPVYLHESHIHGGTRMTGTLFGHRKARVSMAIQDNPRCLPMLLLELAMPTGKLLQDMGNGLMRIALECEKKPNDKTKISDEPVWTMYCNGRKSGYGVKREPTEEDLVVMQTLHVVSMGAGVIPTDGKEQADGELAYMRAYFERVIGSKDSETYYMMNPNSNNGPELSIFFVRM
ncbi:hypothetical protein K2173_024679 [Erythroxylum novogranatense]|uniref:Protein MIZU-KUSSEI 1 n=1 Tax=Erythroxylum novogranatense TaxID=1862640 RepID=A0AAV8SV07_9ROSI|nr:hypothetical protein K2173_024679 [Erythroxylum novogranatense]